MAEPTVSNAQLRRSRAIASRLEQQQKESVREAERTQLLLGGDQRGQIVPERDFERTWRAKQYQILEDADDNTRAKAMQLELAQSYCMRFTGNGRHMVIGGNKGHLAVIDALRSNVLTELSLEHETVHDVTALHNETLFAAAQKKYLYIYDHTGTEIHQLRTHIEPRKIEFLPYHFLLASVGRSSRLVYEDVSTGTLVASLRTKMGPCSVLAQNPQTAVLATGHSCGVVAMWAPTNGDALVKVLCHSAPVTAVQFDPTGGKMATTSLDGKLHVWDCRKLGTKLNSYFVPPPRVGTCLAVSQTGMLALGMSGDRVSVWRDVFGDDKQQDPYLSHRTGGSAIHSLHFRPFEDVLGMGLGNGVQTIIVPGAGEANYDAFENNPFERKNQRREAEVRRLLDKLPADTIGLGAIGEVFEQGADKAQGKLEEHEDGVLQAEEPAEKKLQREKRKMKGKGRIGSRLKVKHRNIIRTEMDKQRARNNEVEGGKKDVEEPDHDDHDKPAGALALDRLVKKPRKQHN